MTLTSTGLTRATGVAAAAAGAIFVAVQINHPPMVAESVGTTEWVLRSIAKAVMAALALAGITGLYLHVRRSARGAGWLALLGYLLLAVGYLAMFATEVIAAIVLPTLVASEPGFVDDVLTAAAGGTPAADIGGVAVLLNLSGVGDLLGGLTFGIALLRTGEVARWAAALLALGTVGTAALAVLPEGFNRPLAVPVGIALIGLGVSLWRRAGRSPAPTAELAPVREPAVP